MVYSAVFMCASNGPQLVFYIGFPYTILVKAADGKTPAKEKISLLKNFVIMKG